MADKRVCKDCAYWAPVTDSGPGYRGEYYRRGGLCECPEFGSSYFGCDDSALICDNDENSKFWVGPLFGCVHWEPIAGTNHLTPV